MTLYPRRSSAILLLAAGCAFTGLGVWMGLSGEWTGFLVAGFFGLCIPVGVIQLVPGSAFLRIDAAGITYSSLFRKTSLPWAAFDAFFVVTMRQTGLKVHEMVGFNFAPTYERHRTARAVASAIAACEGALPDTYGKKAEELARILNECLLAARAG